MFADCGAAATTKLERLQNAHVDQHIYKTFKMLQNGVLVLGGSSGPGGLFWVLPIWSCFCFYKSVKVLRHLCRSEDRLPEPEPIRARPPPQAPQETPPPRRHFTCTVHRAIKRIKERKETQLRPSGFYRSAFKHKSQKGSIWGGGKHPYGKGGGQISKWEGGKPELW